MGNAKERNTRHLTRSVMSLYEGAKTKIRVDSKLSEEFQVKVGTHQIIVLSPIF